MEIPPIFYLENDENDFVLLNHALGKAGRRQAVRWFRTCAQLRAALENAAPEDLPKLIVSDLNLDGESGLDFLDWHYGQERLRHIPVFIFSSGRVIDEVADSLKRYAAAYIFKPPTLDGWRQVARDLVEIVEQSEADWARIKVVA